MAEPLYELTKKNASWNWSGKCDMSFCGLRNKLVREPVLLAFPNWNKSFVVEADASISAVAAVLSAKDHVVSHACEELTRTGEVLNGQLRKITSHLSIREGMLLFDDSLVVPKRSQRTVLQEVHAAGHFGQARTVQLLKRSFFWVGMARYVRDL